MTGEEEADSVCPDCSDLHSEARPGAAFLSEDNISLAL